MPLFLPLALTRGLWGRETCCRWPSALYCPLSYCCTAHRTAYLSNSVGCCTGATNTYCPHIRAHRGTGPPGALLIVPPIKPHVVLPDHACTARSSMYCPVYCRRVPARWLASCPSHRDARSLSRGQQSLRGEWGVWCMCMGRSWWSTYRWVRCSCCSSCWVIAFTIHTVM